MTDGPVTGGKRRIDRILAEDFREGLDALDMDEIRERRDLCRSERDYLSFVRRLLQGRRDLLQHERARRDGEVQAESMVERIAEAMADAPRGPSRGEAMVVAIPDEEIALARRRVERLLSDARLSNIEALSDEELGEAIEHMEEEERKISDTRAGVLGVHDALQNELKQRYRTQLKRLRA